MINLMVQMVNFNKILCIFNLLENWCIEFHVQLCTHKGPTFYHEVECTLYTYMYTYMITYINVCWCVKVYMCHTLLLCTIAFFCKTIKRLIPYMYTRSHGMGSRYTNAPQIYHIFILRTMGFLFSAFIDLTRWGIVRLSWEFFSQSFFF